MSTFPSKINHLAWLLSTVILAMCADAPIYWACFEGNCYYSSHEFMNQNDARPFCEKHNMTSGIANPSDFEKLKGVPFAGNYTWLGIQRYPQDSWKFLSGQTATVNTEASFGCAYQRNTQTFSTTCYAEKKYVCHNKPGIESNYTIHHTSMSWYEARNDCLKHGGDLYDPGVFGYIIFEMSDEHFWLGIRKDKWIWTATGKEANMTNWSPSQPHGNGSCVSFNVNGWYVFDCQNDYAQALCVKKTRKDSGLLSSTSAFTSAQTITTSNSTTSSMQTSSSSSTLIATTTPTITPSSFLSSSSSSTENANSNSDTFSATPSPPEPPTQTPERPPRNDVPLTDSDSTVHQMASPSSTKSPKSSEGGGQDTNNVNPSGSVDPVKADGSQNDTNKIIGGAVGGAVTLLVIIIIAVIILRRKKRSGLKESDTSESFTDYLPEATAGPYYNVGAGGTSDLPHYENHSNIVQQQQPGLNPYENLRSNIFPKLYTEVARPATPDVSSFQNETAADKYFSDDTPKPLDPSVVYAVPMKRKIVPH